VTTAKKPYIGSLWRADNGKWDIRIRAAAPNNQIVFTSHRQGFNNYNDAAAVLAHVLWGGPHVVRGPDGQFLVDPSGAWTKRRVWPFRAKPFEGITWRRDDGKWENRIIIPVAKRPIVLTSHGQGYSYLKDAQGPLVHLLAEGPHVLLDPSGEPVPIGELPTRRALKSAVRGL
jgi:hypothetical protein